MANGAPQIDPAVLAWLMQTQAGAAFPPLAPMPGRFRDAFAPPGGGQIMDLQTAFDQRNAPPAPTPPTMTAQDGVSSIFGVQAAPNALPFVGAQPAEAATVASPLPKPMTAEGFDARYADGTPPMAGRFSDAFLPSISPGSVLPSVQDMQASYDRRLGGGSVIEPTPPQPAPGTVPASGPPIQLHPPSLTPPAPIEQPSAPQPGRRSLFQGPVGGLMHAVAPGLFPNAGQAPGIGGGLLGFLASQRQPSFTPGGNSGTAPGGMNWQHGNVGNNPGMQYTTPNGTVVTTMTDPFTGQTITGYS